MMNFEGIQDLGGASAQNETQTPEEKSSQSGGAEEKETTLCLLECRWQEFQDETESFRDRTPGK